MNAVAARLDAELVRRGLARSRARAAALITQGRVRVAGAVARRPSQAVTAAVALDVMADGRTEYVSRAAHKLTGALDAVGELAPGRVVIAGSRCLDAGASTGGFTQVLLERGARHVFAVNVGHGQIDPGVAADPRVTVREGVNVRDLTAADIGGHVDVVVADLSFISLTVVMPALLAVTRPGGDLLCMVKPQFEVGRGRLGRSGVVTSVALREEAVCSVARSAALGGARMLAVVPSSLPGPAGNREYFLWFSSPSGGRQVTLDGMPAAVRAAVRDGVPSAIGELTGRSPQ